MLSHIYSVFRKMSLCKRECRLSAGCKGYLPRHGHVVAVLAAVGDDYDALLADVDGAVEALVPVLHDYLSVGSVLARL